MIKHIWSILGRSSVIDTQSNNISIQNVFESLQVDIGAQEKKDLKIINVPIDYELVNFWGKTTKNKEEQMDIQLLFLDPAGKETKIIEKKLIIPADKRRMRDINKIQGISITTSGDYVFKVLIRQSTAKNFEEVAELPLEVKINKNN